MNYTVEYGHHMARSEQFGTFVESLAFFIGFTRAVNLLSEEPRKHVARIVNYDRAELGNSGLTEDEREALSNAE